MTLPAATSAPSPIVTGATSAVFEPMKAPAPIVVRYLLNAVVIAGDRAGADIGAGADVAVADIGEVVGLGAGAEPGGLDLDEIADMHVCLEHRAGAQPGKRPDDRARPDLGAFEMREGADAHLVRRP